MQHTWRLHQLIARSSVTSCMLHAGACAYCTHAVTASGLFTRSMIHRRLQNGCRVVHSRRGCHFSPARQHAACRGLTIQPSLVEQNMPSADGRQLGPAVQPLKAICHDSASGRPVETIVDPKSSKCLLRTVLGNPVFLPEVLDQRLASLAPAKDTLTNVECDEICFSNVDHRG